MAHDDYARRRIGPWKKEGQPALDDFAPETNFVVRAAAGSGKTTALVARMVALVRQGVPVEDLAAITFTRKAAGEMNERLFRELRRARGELDGAEQERVAEAARALPRCFIGTVHAFCARILRRHPLAAGLPPRFRAGIEEREERELRAQAFEEHLGQAHREHPETLETLSRCGIEPDDLGPFFQRLCQFPDLEPYTDGPDRPPDMSAAAEEAEALLETWQPRRPDPLPKGRDRAMKAFDHAEKLLAHGQVASPAGLAAFLECFDGVVKDGKAKLTLSAWGERGTDAYDRAYDLRDEELPYLARHTLRPKLRRWEAWVHRRATEFLWPAVARYRKERRDRGVLTHSDLLFFTRELLRDRPAVRRRVQKRYPRLLVDEFQDTDPLQAEILFYLASDDPGEKDWRRCTPRAGSLFIVGDDKQSIYRFRRADKGVFDEVSRLVAKSQHGAQVDLTRNFRSLGALCQWCNDAFAELFAEPELADVQADYVPFEADRPAGADPCGLRRIDIDKVSGNWGADIAEKDAARIAGFIRAACDGEHSELAGGEEAVFDAAATYDDFLILTRTKGRLSAYADALAARSIPFDVTGSEDLGHSPELRALLGLLRCALRPDDPVAAAAYLHGGVCGFSDADLLAFKRAGGRFDQMTEGVAQDTLDVLPEALAGRFDTAFRRVADAREKLTSTRPTLAVEALAREAGLVAGAVHPEDPAAASLRGGQILRALTYVRHLAGQGLEWSEITEELQRIVDGDETVDSMTLETGRGAAVRLMNVHQAKGLEAPVVFLADPYSRGGGNHTPNLHVRREAGEVAVPVVQGESHYQTISHAPLAWYEEGREGPGFQSEEARYQEAEGHRLLYVAATRAENMLVVSTYEDKPGGGYWGALHDAIGRADAPPLPSTPEGDAVPAYPPAPDLDAAAEQRHRRVRALSQPSFEAVTVTAAKGAGQNGRRLADGPFANEGYGKTFGTAVHALFEMLVRERAVSLEGIPVQALLEHHMETPTEEAVQRARRMGEGLLGSDLWRDVRAAQRAYAEYPVTLATKTNDADEPALSVQRGTIDLLYETPEGEWHLVDFKTDRLGGEVKTSPGAASLDAAHPYCRQVRVYGSAWAKVSGAAPAQQGLWLADANALHVVPPA